MCCKYVTALKTKEWLCGKLKGDKSEETTKETK